VPRVISFREAKGYAAKEIMILGEAGKQIAMMSQLLASKKNL